MGSGRCRRRRLAVHRLARHLRVGRVRALAVGHPGHQGRGLNLGPGRDPGVTLEMAHVRRVLDSESIGGCVVQLDLEISTFDLNLLGLTSCRYSPISKE